MLNTIKIVSFEHQHKFLVVALAHEFLRSVGLNSFSEGYVCFLELAEDAVDDASIITDFRLELWVGDLLQKREGRMVRFFLYKNKTLLIFDIVNIGVFGLRPNAVVAEKQLVIFLDGGLYAAPPVSCLSFLNVCFEFGWLYSVALDVI